jgi:large conductance mechanosensitive channel
VVDGLLMPVVTFFLPDGNWRTATAALGPIELRPGPVLAALLDFTIVAFVVFFIAKQVLKEPVVAKK